MKAETIFRNIYWNARLMVVQMDHASAVKTRAKSGYYKAAILVGGSVIEALIYMALRKKNRLFRKNIF